MKKRILSFFLALAMMLQLTLTAAMAYPTPAFGAQDSVSKFENGIPMAVAHRAAWRSGPENSLLAIASSIEMGVDVAELDVKLTKDGVAVLSHDETIDRCTMGSGSIANYTWEQLSSIALKPEEGGGSSPYILTEEDALLLNSLPHYAEHCASAVVGGTLPLTRLDDALDLLKQLGPDTMINLDHCFSMERFVACYMLFREAGLLDNVFFKNSMDVDTMNSWYEAAAAAWSEKYPENPITADEVKKSILYVYIIHNSDYSALQSHLDNGDNLVMVEICISDDGMDAQIQEKLEPWCKENGVAMFVNTMWSGLCSTKADTETTWAEMLDRGYTAIQTDRPSELAEYITAYNGTRNAKDTIEAEHFHLFNYEDYGLSVAAASDANLNKQVENMESGDYLEYRNIAFDGTESLLNVFAKGLSSGELSVYLDGMGRENRIAQIFFSSSSDYQTVSAAIEREIPAGTHTVYLKVSGAVEMPLLSVDYFRFARASEILDDAVVSAVSVETKVGVAPILPASVEVTVGEDKYGLEVRWEQIPEENYAAEGQFTVLGYIPVLGIYIKAAVTVTGGSETTPDIPEEHLVLWLDASEGVSTQENTVTSWKSRAGDITATLKTGSPTLTDRGAGGKAGIYFDGDDAMDLILPDNFWNDKSDFTVIMYVSSENKTSGNGSGTQSQYHSVMYFGETSSWGSAYFNASQNEVTWRFGSGISGDYGTVYPRQLSVGEMFGATAIRKDGTDEALFVDGEKIYTGRSVSDSTRNISSAGWIGVGKNNTYFKGTICELLIYDTALTDEQVLAVQLALDEKYADEIVETAPVEVRCEAGHAPVMPETVAVAWKSGNTAKLGVRWESINPNDYLNEGKFSVKGTLANGLTVMAEVTVTEAIEDKTVTEDGMLFWLSSSEGITADENGVISEWTSVAGDYSAKWKKGDAVLQGNAVKGNPAVVFDGDEDVLQMDLEEGRLNGLTGVTVITYAAPETEWKYNSSQSFDWNVQRRTLFYVDESGSWGSFYAGIYSDAVSARFGTGTGSDAGFRQERAESSTDYSTTVIRWDGNSRAYDVDVDRQDFGTGTSLSGTTGNNKNIVYFGTGKENSYWTGSVCEIMVYDRVLTDDEVNSIYNYLEDKYAEEPAKVRVSGIYLKEQGQQLAMYRTDTLKLTASAVPANADNGRLIYSSSNPEVAAVDENGVITAKDFGYAAITVTTEEGGYQSYCSVFVDRTDAEKIWQNIQDIVAWAAAQDADLYSNWDEMQKALELVETVSEASSKEELESVYRALRQAMLNLLEAVDYRITVESADQVLEAGDDLTVVVLPDSQYLISVQIDENSIDADHFETAGDEKGLSITLKGDYLSTVGLGRHILTILFANGEAETSFTLIRSVTGIRLDQTEVQLKVGDEMQLNAVVEPCDATNRTVYYESSDTDVVTVDNSGKIIAAGLGKAVICAVTEEGGYRAECMVVVSEKETEGCRHEKTWITGKKNAACTEDGYTGDVTCKICGEIVEKGRVIAKTGHHYSNGICTVCGAREQTAVASGDATPTGDIHRPEIPAVMAAVSCIGLFYLFARRKRE